MNEKRKLSFIDKCCLGFDQALRALVGEVKTTGAPYPATHVNVTPLTDAERKQSSALMRVNHAGEICAQALYQGQALVSRSPELQAKLVHAALEEGDHLSWCRKRIQELGSHPSYLNPLWYGGSFCIGMVAGMIGDKWSLGFLAETERQVIEHLEKQLAKLPAQDKRSYQILKQMESDEAKHRDQALHLGASTLPYVIKKGMRFTSKIMVKTAYWF